MVKLTMSLYFDSYLICNLHTDVFSSNLFSISDPIFPILGLHGRTKNAGGNGPKGRHSVHLEFKTLKKQKSSKK